MNKYDCLRADLVKSRAQGSGGALAAAEVVHRFHHRRHRLRRRELRDAMAQVEHVAVARGRRAVAG